MLVSPYNEDALSAESVTGPELSVTRGDRADTCNGSDTESSVLCLGSRLPLQLSKACHSIQRNICLTSYWKFVARHYSPVRNTFELLIKHSLTIKKTNAKYLLFTELCILTYNMAILIHFCLMVTVTCACDAASSGGGPRRGCGTCPGSPGARGSEPEEQQHQHDRSPVQGRWSPHQALTQLISVWPKMH